MLADGRACGRLQRDVVRSAPGPRAARRKSPRPHRRPLNCRYVMDFMEEGEIDEKDTTIDYEQVCRHRARGL